MPKPDRTIRFRINGAWVHYDAALLQTLRLRAASATEQCDGCGFEEFEATSPVCITCSSCGTSYHGEDV